MRIEKSQYPDFTVVIIDLVGDVKLAKDSKPPLPKVHSTPKKPSTPKSTEVRKPTEKLIRSAKSSPRITPKATPLQSPGIEHAPFIRETVEIIKHNDGKDARENVKLEDKNEEKKDQGSEKIQVNFLLRQNLEITSYILKYYFEIKLSATYFLTLNLFVSFIIYVGKLKLHTFFL